MPQTHLKEKLFSKATEWNGTYLHRVHVLVTLLVVGRVHEDLIEDLVETRYILRKARHWAMCQHSVSV
jgi:hypothetical protein